jgi:phage baseplate assembly protein W
MKQQYYSLPLRLDDVIQGQHLTACSLEESIDQHIHLLITTSFGEIEYDKSFGCIVWETDFDNLTTVNKLRDEIKQSVAEIIQKYESRLEKVKVEVSIRQEELPVKINGRHVKKRIILQVAGMVKSTRRPYSFTDRFFAGPLSYE